jgi:hypothetical protein
MKSDLLYTAKAQKIVAIATPLITIGAFCIFGSGRLPNQLPSPMIWDWIAITLFFLWMATSFLAKFVMLLTAGASHEKARTRNPVFLSTLGLVLWGCTAVFSCIASHNNPIPHFDYQLSTLVAGYVTLGLLPLSDLYCLVLGHRNGVENYLDLR